MQTVITTVFLVVFPVVVIRLCRRFPVMDKIGVVVFCYLGGIVFGNCGLMPQGGEPIQAQVAQIAVAIALPLLLFSMDIPSWVTLAGKAILSMLLAGVSIMMVSGVGYLFLKDMRPDSAWKLAGLSVGLYTGGTPNIAAIKSALGVDNATYILFHTYDTVFSLLFILFVVSIAHRVFGRFLPAFSSRMVAGEGVPRLQDTAEDDISRYAGLLTLSSLKRLWPAVLFALVLVVIAGGAGELLPESSATALVILLITSGGIAASFFRRIRSIPGTFQLGMVFIYIFCVAVGSMTDLKALSVIDFPLMAFVGGSLFGSMAVHALFCRLFQIDTDTFLITSTAAICSPPFVPVVAGALKNREVLLSGLATGIMGFAMGNYLGIAFAHGLRMMETFT